MKIEKLNWDSNFFGFDVGKIEIENENIFDFNFNNNFKLIYVFANKKLNINTFKNKANNFEITFVDKKTTYQKPIESNNNLNTTINLYLKSKVEKQLLNLTYLSGGFSRFKIDENFENNTFEKLYKLWIEKSITDTNIDIIVQQKENQINGFVTLNCNSTIAKIGLIAVNEKSRAQKIATKLLNFLENLAIKKQFKTLQVVTQGNNVAACKFYENYGFKKINVNYIYHIWKK